MNFDFSECFHGKICQSVSILWFLLIANNYLFLFCCTRQESSLHVIVVLESARAEREGERERKLHFSIRIIFKPASISDWCKLLQNSNESTENCTHADAILSIALTQMQMLHEPPYYPFQCDLWHFHLCNEYPDEWVKFQLFKAQNTIMNSHKTHFSPIYPFRLSNIYIMERKLPS